MNITELERKVFNVIIDFCVDYPEADIKDLSDITSMSENSVKGVVGSLVKKGLVSTGEDIRGFNIKFKTINPIIQGEAVGFMCDMFDESEIESFKL